MARTGINIKMSDTEFKADVNVDSNSMLVFAEGSAVDKGLQLGEVYLLKNIKDLEALGVTDKEVGNLHVHRNVKAFFKSAPTSLLHVVVADVEPGSLSELPDVFPELKNYVRQTVKHGIQFRPRQVGLIYTQGGTVPVDKKEDMVTEFNDTLVELYEEGFCTVGLVSADFDSSEHLIPNFSSIDAKLVAPVIGATAELQGAEVVECHECVLPYALGLLSTLTVGTSIGDGSLNAFSAVDKKRRVGYGDNDTWERFADTLPPDVVEEYMSKQVVFLRTRMPKNGLYFNDGSTATAPTNALSTLEAGRTLASLIDSLREFFVPYINSRVPLDDEGDIQSAYKQIILNDARSKVIQGYISSGDISNARIDVRAKDDDFLGTRTFEVTLSVLPAFSLRWIEGNVFYVSNLD